MKLFLKVLMVFCTVFVFSAGVFAAEKSTEKKPVAFVLSPDYKFPAVLDGTQVVHEFVIMNKGNAPLEILRINTT